VQWVLPPLRLGSQPSASLFGFTHHVAGMLAIIGEWLTISQRR